MRASKWIEQAQKAGWLVRKANVQVATLHLHCAKHGCPGALALPLANLGPIPEPCQLPHVNQYGEPVFSDYREIVIQLQRRRRLLGMSQEDVCAAAGLGDGHVNKLENFDRVAQFPTLQLWAQTLGLGLTLAPVELPSASARIIESRQFNPYRENQARFKETIRREKIT